MEVDVQSSSVPAQCDSCHQSDYFDSEQKICSRCIANAQPIINNNTTSNTAPFQNYHTHNSLPAGWINAKSRSIIFIEKMMVLLSGIGACFCGIVACLVPAKLLVVILYFANTCSECGQGYYSAADYNDIYAGIIYGVAINLGCFIGAQKLIDLNREQFIDSLISISKTIFYCFLINLIMIVLMKFTGSEPITNIILNSEENGIFLLALFSPTIFFSPVIATLLFLFRYLWQHHD